MKNAPAGRLRVTVLGSARFGLQEPFAGGMEAHTADLVRGLRARGHHVTVFAGPATDASLGAVPVWDGRSGISTASRQDISTAPDEVVLEHMAYQRTVLRLARESEADVVHLNCVHHLPVAMAGLIDAPVTATLHCPPTPWLELAYRYAGEDGTAPAAVAVSDALARSWREPLGWRPGVVENGVDLRLWQPGPGDGGYAVWCGRVVPEKAPHLAIDAARSAGLRVRLAGPLHDRAYFEAQIRPRLGPDVVFHGQLTRAGLVDLVGAARVAVVTPVWDEPFGLVAVEALACGTPVAAIANGALPDLIDDHVGALSSAEVPDLADAVVRAAGRDRREVRRRAELRFDLARMIGHYEALFLAARAGLVTGPDHRRAARPASILETVA